MDQQEAHDQISTASATEIQQDFDLQIKPLLSLSSGGRHDDLRMKRECSPRLGTIPADNVSQESLSQDSKLSAGSQLQQVQRQQFCEQNIDKESAVQHHKSFSVKHNLASQM